LNHTSRASHQQSITPQTGTTQADQKRTAYQPWPPGTVPHVASCPLAINIILVHTYNSQEASQEAINAAFNHKADSLVSLQKAVSILYILSKGLFATCVPQFLEHAAGIRPPDAGINVRTSPAGRRPLSFSLLRSAVMCSFHGEIDLAIAEGQGSF